MAQESVGGRGHRLLPGVGTSGFGADIQPQTFPFRMCMKSEIRPRDEIAGTPNPSCVLDEAESENATCVRSPHLSQARRRGQAETCGLSAWVTVKMNEEAPGAWSLLLATLSYRPCDAPFCVHFPAGGHQISG